MQRAEDALHGDQGAARRHLLCAELALRGAALQARQAFARCGFDVAPLRLEKRRQQLGHADQVKVAVVLHEARVFARPFLDVVAVDHLDCGAPMVSCRGELAPSLQA